MKTRKASVRGTFYPSEESEINRYINHFNKVLDDSTLNIDYNFKPRAIISPHAGYVYSGFTANIAFNTIQTKINPKRIIVIGPSHKFAFQGASISLYENYETPLGSLEIDLKFAKQLEEKYEFLTFNHKVHQEHSTETQMPFIKHYFPNTKIIEIVYSNCDYSSISDLINEILMDYDNFVVISTDLSHFHTLNEAKALDNICLNAISDLNMEKFNHGCEACGMIGVKAMVDYAFKNNFKVKLCDYRTSADITNDINNVVGYTSFVLGV